MKSTGFDPQSDIAPIPFELSHCLAAEQLKGAGLSWKPHVGCFVWDKIGAIEVLSPFPHNIYFILNLNRFLSIFGTIEEIEAKLVWLPTWYQARLLCSKLAILLNCSNRTDEPISPEDELLELYAALRGHLNGHHRT
jgi:hypothetical protein